MQQRTPGQPPIVPNGELSIKDRLPSNNISFQSASICTVSEVYTAQSSGKNTSASGSNDDVGGCTTNKTVNSSSRGVAIQHEMDIRVTGVVIYTDLRHDFVIVGDPLHKPTSYLNTSSSPISGSFHTRTVKSAKLESVTKASSSGIRNGPSFSNERIRRSSVLFQTPLNKKHLKYDNNHNPVLYKTPNTNTNTSSGIKTKATPLSTSTSTSTSTPLIGSFKKRKLISVKKNFGSSNKLLSKKKDRKLIYQPKFKSVSTPSSSLSSTLAPINSGVSAHTRTINCESKNQHVEHNNDTNEQNDEESLDLMKVSSITSSSSINACTTIPLSQSNEISNQNKNDANQHKHKDNLHYNHIDQKVLKLIRQNVNQGMKMILIDMKCGQIDIQWKDGDLIMIIGKYLVFNIQGEEQEKSEDDHMKTINRIVKQLNCISNNNHKYGQKNGAGGVTAATSMNEKSHGSYIEARIVKNVNGTDVNLLHQALLLRRQYLESIQSIR